MVHIIGSTKIYVIYLRILAGKYYVGRTSGYCTPEKLVELRAGDCFRGYKTYSGNSKFWKAIQKYGWINVKTEILAVCTSFKEAKDLETYFIYKFDSFKNGYNENNGEGDKDSGDMLFHNTLTLFDELKECNSDCVITKNDYKYNKKFVEYIIKNQIYGKKRIREKINEWGIVESTLSHYLHESSDPKKTRFNKEFYKLWVSEDDIETPIESLF